MKLLRSLIVLSFVSLTLAGARATTVIPPTFDELVTRAETIFEGTVTGLRSEWTGEGSNRHIVTYVSFKVEDAIKGATGADYTIRMFGGTVDGHTMEVSDAPRFKVGDRDILFVENNGTQFIPLVGPKSTFQMIVSTLDNSGAFAQPIVITNKGSGIQSASATTTTSAAPGSQAPQTPGALPPFAAPAPGR